MKFLKRAIQSLVRLTPYEIRKKLPNVTLEAVKLLLAYYRAGGREATVVQIGACDGSMCDPIYDFLRHGKMRALLLEPIPRSFAKLRETYSSTPNVTVVQAAVSRTDGTAVMYGVKVTSKWRPPDESMLYASLLKSHLVVNGVPEEDIEETTVPSYSLQSLFAKYGLAVVDLLQVDTEGYDAEIVKMALELPVPPRCINFEKKCLSTAQMSTVYANLEQQGYLFIHDEMNTLAVHQSVEKSFSA